MDHYTSIKDSAVRKLEEHFPELQERFGIACIGIFGSVSRGEDTQDSDIDILYIFQENRGNLHDYAGAAEYLEKLLGREMFIPLP